jgi:hypothetical protein
MRTVLLALLMSFALDAAAQDARARPEGTMPLDAPPPIPDAVESDTSLETQVITRTEGGQTIEEHRVGGKVMMQRVTPRHGRSYVLMNDRGDGTMTKQDNTLDQGVRVPQWVLLDF